MSTGPTKIERVSRQVIDSKLLAALDDSQVVAVLLNELDLCVVTLALERYGEHDPDGRATQLAEDLEKLRRAAFPTNEPCPRKIGVAK